MKQAEIRATLVDGGVIFKVEGNLRDLTFLANVIMVNIHKKIAKADEEVFKNSKELEQHALTMEEK